MIQHTAKKLSTVYTVYYNQIIVSNKIRLIKIFKYMTKQINNIARSIVKHQLWRNSLSARDVSDVTFYDLIVNKTKVDVRSAAYQNNKDGVYWIIEDLKLKPIVSDVLAIVITTPLNDTLIFYMQITDKTYKELKKYKMINKEKIINGDVICDLFIDTKTLKVLFSDKLKIFK